MVDTWPTTATPQCGTCVQQPGKATLGPYPPYIQQQSLLHVELSIFIRIKDIRKTFTPQGNALITLMEDLEIHSKVDPSK